MCAASLTEICRQAAAPAWNAGTKYVLDHPETVMLYDPADASTNPWKKASEMPDDSHVEIYFVVEGLGNSNLITQAYDTYEEAFNSIKYLGPGRYEINKRFLVTKEAEV